MKNFGVLLIIVGLIFAFFAFSMDTSVEVGGEVIGEGEYSITVPVQRVNNLGLMNEKQNYIMGSGLMILIGVLLFIFAKKEHIEEKKNINEIKISNQDVHFYEINNLDFLHAKNDLVKQYEPLGFVMSIDSPNLMQLKNDNSYIQLKYSIGGNNLNLETHLVSDVPNIAKEIEIPSSNTDKLLKLSDMLEKGLITTEEFIIQKNLLIKL